ncbi:MAG: hypothetical protein K0R54_5313, partial [Clostridiaceae bacterium]|nr:hypothetical protein [Clostridiaceae bacterium]
MRVETVKFAGKDITIREQKIKELTKLYDELGSNVDE